MPQVLKMPIQLLGLKPRHFRYVDKDYFMVKVNNIGIKSARQYWKWLKDFKPAGFPKRPDRTYDESWSVLLNTDNKYLANEKYAVSSKQLIVYWEACNLVQPLELDSRKAYLEAFDNGLIPEGIPRQPDVRYMNFTKVGGWATFLGKKASDKIKAAKNIEPLLILYRNNSQSPNIISVLIYKKGQKSMMDMIREKGIDVVRVYNWYTEFGEHVFELLDRYGSKQSDNTWMFSNLNEILFELGTVLEVFRIN